MEPRGETLDCTGGRSAALGGKYLCICLAGSARRWEVYTKASKSAQLDRPHKSCKSGAQARAGCLECARTGLGQRQQCTRGVMLGVAGLY